MTGFIDTPAGRVPAVSPELNRVDKLGTVGARTGILRNNYSITPGLYALGEPSPQSPVIVTANYKLTFDTVRSSLKNLDCWLLIVDTRGVNVWCAAGKGTFSTDEVIFQVKRCKLSEIVNHKEIILPQLSATGVAALEVRKGTGFNCLFGPIRIEDVVTYLNNDMLCTEEMRTVTFPLYDRLAVVPVEIINTFKPLSLILLTLFLLSGIGPDLYSFSRGIERFIPLFWGSVIGWLIGTVFTPALLPYIPVRQFWLKGLFTSIPFAAVFSLVINSITPLSEIGLACWMLALSSYLAMNFTGSTTYTSLSGVEYEMRRGLPCQLILAIGAFFLWLLSPFTL